MLNLNIEKRTCVTANDLMKFLSTILINYVPDVSMVTINAVFMFELYFP
jgi:hypothetical protein